MRIRLWLRSFKVGFVSPIAPPHPCRISSAHRVWRSGVCLRVDRLCKYLLQISQTKNLFVLTLTLRIVFDLFSTVKQHLKVQLEVFFVSIHLRIADSSTSSFEQKELVMESLVEFCKEPSLIVGLYRNYDSEVGSSDLYSDLCRFLSQQTKR